jgi:hypothetical protein
MARITNRFLACPGVPETHFHALASAAMELVFGIQSTERHVTCGVAYRKTNVKRSVHIGASAFERSLRQNGSGVMKLISFDAWYQVRKRRLPQSLVGPKTLSHDCHVAARQAFGWKINSWMM